jgi:hypothetical protein
MLLSNPKSLSRNAFEALLLLFLGTLLGPVNPQGSVSTNVIEITIYCDSPSIGRITIAPSIPPFVGDG